MADESSEKWKTFDSEELARQYSPSQWCKRMPATDVNDSHESTINKGTELARSTLHCELGISLGTAEKHKLDIYGYKTACEDAPILMYIHGGYWQFSGRESAGFMAPPVVKAGGIVCSVGYTLAPEGNMEQIIAEVKAGVAYVLKEAASRNSRGVYLGGHSAGGHLAAMMLTIDWEAEGLDPSLLKGAFLVSGVYDLRPIANTYVNDPLKMTEEYAIKVSPQFLIDQLINLNKDRILTMAVGENDSEEFRRQGEHFYNTLKSAGINVTNQVIPEVDHFDVMEKTSEEDYVLTKEILKIMGLRA